VVGPSWVAPQGDNMYLLVRLSYSLTAPRNHEIEDAKFSAKLTCDKGDSDPVAFDLFPREVLEESKTNLRLNVKPSLKLEEVEASLGSVETNIHIQRVEPVVTTSGIGASDPTWFFRRHRKHPIVGSRMVYAILAFPLPATQMIIEAKLTATLRGRFGLWLAGLPSDAEAKLRWTIP
jgi:hypothetical protein